MKTRLFTLLWAFLLATLVLGPQASAEEAVEKTGYLPQFETTRTNIEVLEENLVKTGKLAEILKKGNDELSEAIKQYGQDHSAETKDRIYTLLGDLAGKTISEINGIVSNKSKMRDGVTQILYKMVHIRDTLKDKQKKFSEYIKNTHGSAGKIKDELRRLARRVKTDPEDAELRKEFRSKLFKLRNLDNRYKTYLAHQRLNAKFGKQVGLAEQFFQQLDGNTDQLLSNLEEQKEFLVMKVGLLRDTAAMESWLRGEGESNVSAFSMMKKIGELSKALGKFNAATDMLIETNDIGTLIESLPDAGEIFGLDGGSGTKSGNFEDKYVDYFLKH
jgi:hypothetical protein